MGRLIRLVFFTGIAFISGILFERSHQKEECAAAGGQWARAGFCVGE
ncbi:hypothetical protein [Phaeobacter sp. 11ANDIMAR09]|nr:hypothetical protein [Phaeobacter sp. 11ANDIMAR09]